jgi:hypothetical protein
MAIFCGTATTIFAGDLVEQSSQLSFQFSYPEE